MAGLRALLAVALLGPLLLSTLPAGGYAVPPEPIAPAVVAGPGESLDAPGGDSAARGVLLRPSEVVTVTVTLTGARDSALTVFDRTVHDPRSPGYRQFLGSAAFENEFAPPAANVSMVAGYLLAHGALQLAPSADRRGLEVWIPAGRLAGAFGTTWTVSGGIDPAPTLVPLHAPVLPTAIAPMVRSLGTVTGSGSAAPLPHVRALARGELPRGDPTRRGAFVTDNGTTQQWFVGTDFASAYGHGTWFANGSRGGAYASGEAIATLLASGYNDTNQTDLPPFDPGAVSQYFNDTFPAGWPHPNVSAVGVPIGTLGAPAPGPIRNQSDDSGAQLENSLDLEMAGSLAPGSTLVNFYLPADAAFPVSSGSGAPSSTADDFAFALAAALTHNYSPARLVAVSCSFGIPEVNDPLWNQELADAAAMGVTVVAASGDQGSAPPDQTGLPEGAGPLWPASAAFEDAGVLAVGGTNPTLAGTPTGNVDASGLLSASFDPSVSGLASEIAWSDAGQGPGSFVGSEGGISTVYPEPTWQFRSAAQPSIANTETAATGGSPGRAIPDLAFPANSTITYVSGDLRGTYYQVLEGTSIAAPLVAGALAGAAAVDGHPFGYLDPLLYRIGSYYAANPNASGDPFRDIQSGGNYEFRAAPGWDRVTGWGSVDLGAWPAALDNRTLAEYNYSGPEPMPIGLQPPSLPQYGPGPSFGVWLLAGGVAVALAVTLALVVRSERRVPPPPDAPWAPTAPRELPDQTLCAQCGRSRPPWAAFCPWCGSTETRH